MKLSPFLIRASVVATVGVTSMPVLHGQDDAASLEQFLELLRGAEMPAGGCTEATGEVLIAGDGDPD